jgi:internalin A
MTRPAILATICIACFAGVQFVVADDAPNKRLAEKELDRKVVDAWQNAGALVGWLAQSEFGEWLYLRDKPERIESLPVFLWQQYQAEVIAKLPQPAVPFAIGFGGTGMTNAGLKELVKFQNLQALDLSHTQVTDMGLKQLAELKNLHSLDLGASAVTDAGLKQLAGVKNLEKLYFGSTAVTDAGVKELVGLKDLQTMYLYNTQVTDACLKELAGCKKLQALLLTKTKVTDEGVTELSKARPKLQVIR